MSKRLNMVFTQDGRNKTISIENPKDGLKYNDVMALMQKVVEKKFFYEDEKGFVDGVKDAGDAVVDGVEDMVDGDDADNTNGDNNTKNNTTNKNNTKNNTNNTTNNTTNR